MEIQNLLGFILNTSAKLMKRCLDTELKLLSYEDDLSQAEISDKLNTDGAVIEKLISKGLITKTLSKEV